MNTTRGHDGYHSYIEFQFAQRKARVYADAKRTLLADGYVFLGVEFVDLVPMIQAYTPQGVTELRGCTNDPAVLDVVRTFLSEVDGGGSTA